MFLRVAHSRRPLTGYRFQVSSFIRHVSTPKYDSSKNFLASSLDYVRQVDKYQKELESVSSEKQLAADLVGKISTNPELLCILAIFHHELARIGITPSTTPREREALLWKYRIKWVFKLLKINSLFWEQCQYTNAATRMHPLKFRDAKDIGILDPVNFDNGTYQQLQRGELNGVDFREMGGLGILATFGKKK